jgi:parvulin-like peptidyl-prolyl isomerase
MRRWLAAGGLFWVSWALGAAALEEPEEGALVNAIVAIVNNEPVTKLEADALAAEFLRENPSITVQESQATWERAREALIENKLLVQEARRRQVEVAPEEVNEEIERLKKIGLKAEDRRDMVRERLMVARMLAMLHTARSIGPEEVKEYYEKHREDFVLRERRHVFLISIKASDFKDDKAAAKKKAQEILDTLRQGGDFAAQAKGSSKGPFAEKGGDQDWVEKGALLPALEEAVFRLKAGEISNLIESEDGFWIVKVAAVQPATHLSFEKAQQEIERRLQAEHRQKRRTQFIDRLRANASIVRLDLYPRPAPSAEPASRRPDGERK